MQFKKTYIDGYNVLRKLPRLERLMKSNSDAARRGLVEFVRRRMKDKGHVVIVFDGHGDAVGGGAAIRCVFSLTRTADSWIRLHLELERQTRSVLVVSSDNEVRAHALACGASVFSANEFIADIKAPDEDEDREQALKNRQLSESEVRQWLRTFIDADDGETEITGSHG